jgi:MFS family permease
MQEEELIPPGRPADINNGAPQPPAGAVKKLWSRSFTILWQGQLVSSLGDAAYAIALGFWILAVTGSTALMGTLMAASTLPGVLVAPFAGAIIDRGDRKRLLVLMDLLRGTVVVLVAAAALTDRIAVWMVFAAGVILSVCGAFFTPGINSSLPDITPKEKITNANSIFSIASAGSNMLGNAAGGMMFQFFGAPLLVLFNGLSFLFSGFSVMFVKIPAIALKSEQHLLKDIRDGFRYVWGQKGLREALVLAALVNFVSFVAIVLILPMFKQSPSLGSGRYGLAMACFMGGSMSGFLFTSIVKIPCGKKLVAFAVSNLTSCLAIILCVNILAFPLMLVLIALGGFFNAIVNVVLISSIQVATPQHMRGKVLSLMNMLTSGLTPLAMVVGGVLGGLLPIRMIISVCFALNMIILTPLILSPHFRRFMRIESAEELSLPAAAE